MLVRGLRSSFSALTGWLAAGSALIALVVALLTVIDGRVPWFAPLAVIGALMVGVLAATEASRSSQTDVERERRRERERRASWR